MSLCFVFSLLFPQVRDESEFLDSLGCTDVAGVKVISIFGNTGDGKSHTLNHILFGGESVFFTSKSPSSCTVGVWAAYNPSLSLVALDTEGLLGAAANQNQRMRLLLKVILVVACWFSWSKLIIHMVTNSVLFQWPGDFFTLMQALNNYCSLG